MPELPEVRVVCDELRKKILNKKIINIKINLEKIIKTHSKREFISLVKNSTIKKIHNIGKWIVFNLDNDLNILVHLRLEGKFNTEETNSKHDHIVFEFLDNTKLYFNDTRQFGTFHLLGSNYRKIEPISKLGMKLNEVSIENLFKKFSNKKIPIKNSLLDQNIVIGLGNIYVNEVLWYCKVHPKTPTNQVLINDLKCIIENSHKIMEKSYKLGGSSIRTYTSLDGMKGQYQNHLKVHDREKQKCKRCSNKIIKIKVGGRGTYICENCQKY